MKSVLKVTLFAMVALTCTGCAGYWMDRARDAGDIFTLTVGGSSGVAARLGPIGTGLYAAGNQIGLEKGRFGKRGGADAIEGYWLFGGFDNVTLDKKDLRGKGYNGVNMFLINWPEQDNAKGSFSPYWTQIEAKAGILYGGLAVGFNPGELFDFILGFFGVDIYKDDLDRRE